MSLSEYSELPLHAAFTGTILHNRVKSKDHRNTLNLNKNGTTVSMQHIVVEAEMEEEEDDEGKNQKRKPGTRRFVSSEELLKG